MTAKTRFLFSFLLLCQILCAQNNAAIGLKEVVVSDLQLQNFSNSQSVQKLNDSVIRKNPSSLTSLLNYNSFLYFKENGLGMVSSPSFRGTTAQQTAVIWNGININSQFNGQADFNTITTRSFNSVSIRAGGGSVIYGSSAIGGSIHLNNDLEFKNKFQNDLQFSYGSFNTLGLHYNLKAASERFSAQVAVSRNSSDNDYAFPQSDKKNSNGQFDNTSFSANFGYKINASHFIKFYSQIFESERHFSLLSPTDTPSKYEDFNTRNLLEWVVFHNRITSKFKMAFLNEEYIYFENTNNDFHYQGKAETFIAKYDLTYRLGATIDINGLIDYTKTKGQGTDVGNNQREISSFSILMKQQVSKKFQYELGIRKELTDNYESPFLFSAGTNYKFNDWYRMKWNASRNFRIPTFNDLYWTDGGNPDLKPESSYQTEIGNELTFKNFKISVTGYYSKITDMIQWLPGTTASWYPKNINKVNTYGAEVLLSGQKTFGKNQLIFNGTYAYTVSKNEKTGYQLIYVPYHKATAALAYEYGKFTLNYQALFNGEVFTRSDNNSRYILDAYSVSNIGTDYDFGTTNSFKIGFQVLNVLNENYRVVERRPFPGRNYTMYLTLNF